MLPPIEHAEANKARFACIVCAHTHAHTPGIEYVQQAQQTVSSRRGSDLNDVIISN